MSLEKEYNNYLKILSKFSNKEDSIKYCINEYIKPFYWLYELYEEIPYIRVYYDMDAKLVRFCFYFSKNIKEKEIIITEKKMSIKGENIYFFKGNIIIQKNLNPLSLSICTSLYDLSEIKSSIQEAELERIKAR